MPLFFFDFCDNGRVTADPLGVDFTNAEEAYLDAFHATQDMWSELLKQRIDPRNCTFEIRDSGRQLLFEVPFVEALDVCKPTKSEPQRRNPALSKSLSNVTGVQTLLNDFRDELSAAQRSLGEVCQNVGKLV